MTPASSHDLLGLAETVARILGREGVADDGRNVAMGLGELRLARLRPADARTRTRASAAALFDILDLDGLAGHPLRQGRGHEPVEVAVEHVAGAVEVTPVRRSLTS